MTIINHPLEREYQFSAQKAVIVTRRWRGLPALAFLEFPHRTVSMTRIDAARMLRVARAR